MFNNRSPLNSGKPFPNRATGPLASGLNKLPLGGAKPAIAEMDGAALKEGLQNLQFVLEYMNYETAHIPVDSENTVEQLFVSLAAEDEEFAEDSPFAQIMFINDLVAPVMETNQVTNITFILQFFVSLTVIVPPEKRQEIHGLLSALSNLTPIGHLAFNAETGIFFRYNLVTHKREVEPEVALEIIEMIKFFVLAFTQWIDQFCRGVINFEQAIENIEKELGKPRL
jgi:hypothetical protein